MTEVKLLFSYQVKPPAWLTPATKINNGGYPLDNHYSPFDLLIYVLEGSSEPNLQKFFSLSTMYSAMFIIPIGLISHDRIIIHSIAEWKFNHTMQEIEFLRIVAPFNFH